MPLTRPKAAQVNFDVTNITDPLLRFNSGQTGTNDKDTGIVLERGDDSNVALIWDESADEFALITTTEDGTTSGNVTISSYANLQAGTINTSGLTVDTNTLYVDVTNSRVGIGTSEPSTELQVNGTITSTALAVTGSTATIDSKDIMVGKSEGTNFTDSLLVGHGTTGTLNSATNNTGVGIGALDALTSGDNNTAVGSNAGTLLTTGTRNTMLGSGAGNSVNSAVNNTLIGSLAGAAIANAGHYNTLIGKSAGQTITTGDGNVIIGVVNADSDTGDRQLKIAGYDGTTTTTWI